MEHAKENKLARRLVTLVTAVAACVALCAGGTLAYFSAEERAHNVITTGGVDIELREWADVDRTAEFENITGVMPGTEVTKAVEVANVGQGAAWVRVKVTKAIEMQDGSAAPDLDLIRLNFDEGNWEFRDGWWYFKSSVPGKGEGSEAVVTPYLFTTVTFDGAGMGNPYQGAEISIDVQAQAVQVANNGDSALTASGWPAE